ncbi:MAG TPA: DUF3846 domain-containing protein [Edaphobacter sp.]|nr:DUF3846 domain-containing protein [Edaphobacter sp.]
MATLYREDGTTDDVLPANGINFTLEEMQTLVGGYIQLCRTLDNKLIMVVDEDGKVKGEGKPINIAATSAYIYGEHDPIVGSAVVGTLLEINGPEDVDEEETA